jgi:hypothetical protein
MARKSAPAPAAVEVVVETEALASASRALATVSADAQAMATTFGLASMEPAVLEAEISGLVAQTGRALFEIGVRLVALRSVMPSGEWTERIQRLGFSPRSAARMMSAALKVADANGEARSSLLALPQAKVLELVTLDEASLDQLEKDGRIGGQLNLDFDDIDRLSVAELRARLRSVEQSNEAKDRVIANKSKALDKLEEKLHATSPEDADAARAEELLYRLREATAATEAALMQLSMVALDTQLNHWPEHVKTAGRTAVEYLAQRMADTITHAGVPVQFDEMVVPDWLQTDKKAKRRA